MTCINPNERFSGQPDCQCHTCQPSRHWLGQPLPTWEALDSTDAVQLELVRLPNGTYAWLEPEAVL